MVEDLNYSQVPIRTRTLFLDCKAHTLCAYRMEIRQDDDVNKCL